MNSELERIQDGEFAVSPSGLHIGETQEEVDAILEIVSSNLSGAFVEIGVHIGGLADTMLDLVEGLPSEFAYLGIEIDQGIVNVGVKNRIASLDNASIWYVDAHRPETHLAFTEWLGQVPMSCVIYCDGGKKPLEFSFYAPLARPGDIVAVHDYGTYEGAEISPSQAAEVVGPLGYASYRPGWSQWSKVRIAAWRA